RKGLKRWGAAEVVQGTVVFISSIATQGMPGEVSYWATKAGLEGAAATLAKEATYYGVRATAIHAGRTGTPMVQALGPEYPRTNRLPYTQLKRLVQPEEIADAISCLISTSAVSGELWADAGWHPSD